MAFVRKKKEAEPDPEPVIEEAEVIISPILAPIHSGYSVEEAEVIEPEKEWISPNSVFPNNQQGGEPIMAVLDTTEDARESNGGSSVIHGGEEAAKRNRVMLTDHWIDAPTAAAFEKVRKSVGVGFPMRGVTDAFFGHPSRIHTELPEPPPIESYNAAEIGAKVKAALLANL